MYDLLSALLVLSLVAADRQGVSQPGVHPLLVTTPVAVHPNLEQVHCTPQPGVHPLLVTTPIAVHPNLELYTSNTVGINLLLVTTPVDVHPKLEQVLCNPQSSINPLFKTLMFGSSKKAIKNATVFITKKFLSLFVISKH